MATIQLMQAKEGDILSTDVSDEKNIVLIKSGMTLTKELIAKLMEKGIKYVNISSKENSNLKNDDSPLHESEVTAINKRIDTMFSGMLDNEIMKQFADSAKEYLIKKLPK
jgi:hypothetical protein